MHFFLESDIRKLWVTLNTHNIRHL